MSTLEDVRQAVLVGDEQVMADLVNGLLKEGTPADRILSEGLLAGMTEVGRRFREYEYFIPEVLVAAGAMKEAMQVLRPHLTSAGVKPFATAVIATVKGDLHDIGKNLVATMLEGAGFEVVDLGVDVSPEQLVAACQSRPVDLVALSALLTTTMPAMVDAVQVLKRELHPAPRIIVGGAPVTQEFADRIGADGYGRDAATGAEVARRLCTK
ncbi:MAG TPA: corrinoid protein [Phycisphaerae bacterium]|nr:corrinoid protein [Phycisphaerae bacterium]HPZ97760.1 corrinoid protein [Phycisphaerae bacterium]